MKRVLMVIAPETFRDEEYAHPKEVLQRRSAEVVTTSRTAGTCRGKLGMTAEATIALASVRPEEYDAIVFVGGGGAETYFDDPVAHTLARSAFEQGKIVAAICIAPSILAHAGLLEGVHVTAFESQKDDLARHRAVYTGHPVEVEGHIITANGPGAAYEFGEAIADALGLP